MSEPTLQQLKVNDLGARITIQKRAPGALQIVKDAAVYILGLRSSSPGGPPPTLSKQITTELRAHLSVLRTNTSATLILAPRLLPEPGTVDPDIEATARLRDLSLLQLANEREMEMDELVEMVNSLRDSIGRLVVVNKLRSFTSSTVALGVKYQAYSDGHDDTEPTSL